MRPILFSVAGYDFFAAPIFAGLSTILACLYVRANLKHADLSVEDYWTLMLYLAVGTSLSGVLLYMAVYGGGFASNFGLLLKYRRIPGGSFFGNLWGGALAAWAFSVVAKRRAPATADLVGVAALAALALMRVGCVQHGCCYGRPTDLPWAIVFDHARCVVPDSMKGIGLHPTQAYEALWAALSAALIHFQVLPRIRRGALPAGAAFAAAVALYAVFRFPLEFIRAGNSGVLAVFGMTSSQVLALASLAGAAILYRRLRRQA